MIFASTTDVFSGWPAGTPCPPDSTPLRPGSVWAAVKALNENLCAAYSKRLATPVVSVRLKGDATDGERLREALKGSGG
jgi:nucleoside-diphosphate-sugar epimerase